MYSDAYISLSGNVTNDPKMSKAKETPVCTFPMAVRNGKRDENGRFKTDYYKISVFNNDTIAYVMNQVSTGARVRVAGFQKLDAYNDDDSVPHAVAYIDASDVKIDARPKPKTEEEA